MRTSFQTPPKVAVRQVWRDKDKNGIERFVRVIEVTATDALVRSCVPTGEFCIKTPRTWVSLSRLQKNFICLPHRLTVLEYDTLAKQ